MIRVVTLAAILTPVAAAQVNDCSAQMLVPGAAPGILGFASGAALGDDVVLVNGFGTIGNRAWIFRRAGSQGLWVESQVLTPQPTPSVTGGFGTGLDIDGDHALIGMPSWENAAGIRRGLVYAYERDAGTGHWSQTQSFPPPASFGQLSLGAEVRMAGDLAAIGGPGSPPNQNPPAVLVYTRNPLSGSWSYVDVLPIDGALLTISTFSRTIAVRGDRVAVGVPKYPAGGFIEGRVDVFQVSAGGVTHLGTIHDPAPNANQNSWFGKTVSFAGDRLVVGSNAVGAYPGIDVDVFEETSPGGWTRVQVLTPADWPGANGHIYSRVTGSEDLIAVNAGLLPAYEGSVVVYERVGPGSTWVVTHDIDRGAGGDVQDLFGATLDARGHELVAGSGQIDLPSGLNAGALWAFDLDPTDCDGNLVRDACDVVSGLGHDLNHDGALDECQSVGVAYCSPAATNSTGFQGRLRALGSDVAAEDALEFGAELLPPGEFAMLLGSSAPDQIPFAGGGNLCLAPGPDFGRFNDRIRRSDPLGALHFPVELGAIPTGTAPVALLMGDSWYFQVWYRDGATSLLTTAVRITFQ